MRTYIVFYDVFLVKFSSIKRKFATSIFLFLTMQLPSSFPACVLKVPMVCTQKGATSSKNPTIGKCGIGWKPSSNTVPHVTA